MRRLFGFPGSGPGGGVAIVCAFLAGCGGGEGFTVVNEKPSATIVAPTEGVELYPGVITLRGVVADKEDTPVDLKATFAASPATGQSQTCSPTPDSQGNVQCDLELEAGAYTVTLSVVDTAGGPASTSSHFTVLLNHPPTAEITAPVDGFTLQESDGLGLTGQLDDQDEGAGGLGVSWQLDGVDQGGNAPDSSGKVDFFFAPFTLEPGDHVVQLVASDFYGDTGVDPLNISVIACQDKDKDGSTTCTIGNTPPDCDDDNPRRAPDQPEVCDAEDNNCNDRVDEGWDADGDRFTVCGGPAIDADCNDTDPNIYPGAAERCNSLDDNCDGLSDDGLDLDGDTYTPCGSEPDCNDNLESIHPHAVELCNGVDDDCNEMIDDSFDQDGDGVTSCNGDCDDTKAAINPTAIEACDGIDNDCDQQTDEGFDKDQDNYVSCPQGDRPADCNDNDGSVYPHAFELCDNKDNDCNGTMDEGLDTDGDGFTPCALPLGDCDDASKAVNPGAAEVCNGIDDNCSKGIDEGFDKDGDTYYTCVEGSKAADCNDFNPDVHPDAEETCNGTDDNCNNVTDENVKQVYYKDADGDGYGDPRSSVTTCSPPQNYSSNNQDCDDDHGDSYPGASEVLDGRDNDCDGTIDEGTECWDDDGDGYLEATPQGCPGYPEAFGLKVPKGGDCNDTNFYVNPGRVESASPDGIDNNCDGTIDENTACWDDDVDGYAETDVSICPGYPTAYGDSIPLSGDCDDHDAYTYPGAAERFDGEDNDCDGAIEDQVPLADSDVIYVGSLAKAQAGYSVAGPGDMNGDQWDDLVIGAPGYDPLGQDRGGVYIVFGKSAGWKDTYQLGDTAILINEEFVGSRAGFAVSTAGDLNKDGLADFVVGAPYNSASASGGGVSYILFGAETGWLTQSFFTSGALTVKGFTNVNLGTSLAGGGDITGDGIDDLVIGAPGGAGFALILPGKSSGWLSSVTSNDLGKVVGGQSTDNGLGTSMAFTGLTNGDSVADLVVGSRYDSNSRGSGVWLPGASKLASNSLYQLKDLSAVSYRGIQNGDMVGGGWVAAGGDVNADGKGDFFLGRDAWLTQSEAAVYLYLGGTLPAAATAQSSAPIRFTGADKDDCPCAAAGIGDINGDDIDDFLIGMSGNDSIGANAGKVYLFYGRSTGFSSTVSLTTADMTFTGEGAGDLAGWTIGPAGDMNGDGLADFFIGAPNADNGSTKDVGKVYVMFGYPH